MKLSRGTMILSLDLELCWGRFDKRPVPLLEADSSEERNQIKRLLFLMDRYEIPATWAIVGHLMLDECARNDGKAHADIFPHAEYSWFRKDWYVYDPCTSAARSPGWYAPDIVEWIRKAQVRHEIASHSFAHIDYGDPECSASTARADLTAAVEAAGLKDITLKSFVFPRNQVGHLDVLREHGFRAYRGIDPRFRNGSELLVKTLSFLDHLMGLPPKAVHAKEGIPGLWNIPGNHFYMARSGIRKIIPIATRKDACIDIVFCMHCRLSTPQRGGIHNVVVKQRKIMKNLNGHSNRQRFVNVIGKQFATHQGKQCP